MGETRTGRSKKIKQSQLSGHFPKKRNYPPAKKNYFPDAQIKVSKIKVNQVKLNVLSSILFKIVRGAIRGVGGEAAGGELEKSAKNKTPDEFRRKSKLPPHQGQVGRAASTPGKIKSQ